MRKIVHIFHVYEFETNKKCNSIYLYRSMNLISVLLIEKGNFPHVVLLNSLIWISVH